MARIKHGWMRLFLVWCLLIAVTFSTVFLVFGVVALSSRIHLEYAPRSLLAGNQNPSRPMSRQLRDTTLEFFFWLEERGETGYVWSAKSEIRLNHTTELHAGVCAVPSP